MTELNFYQIFVELKEEADITEEIFIEILNTYEITIEEFEDYKDQQMEFTDQIINTLLKKENRNFHTISSKDNFTSLIEDASEEMKYLMYQPLNDHSRGHLGVGDILFSYRNGQFNNLDEALRTRGIYGMGIALSNPIKFSEEHSGRDDYKNYLIVVVYPFTLLEHLSVRDIQLNPNTINLTPYNGNRNDSLQFIPEREHYLSLLGMILTKNPHISEFISFMNLPVEESIIPDELWNSYNNENAEEDENIKEVTEETDIDYKLEFINWLRKKKKDVVRPKTVSNYVSALNTLENTWNANNETVKVKVWKDPYHLKNQIGRENIFSETYIRDLNNRQNNSQSAAINYYFNFLNELEKLYGINRIYFGAPGTGKSFSIQNFIQKNGLKNYTNKADHPNVFRTTFHPEYSYHDFVGQVMPVVIPVAEGSSETKIEYKFNPQIFTNALNYAIHNKVEPVFLILEEMSRANVASIFGDIFQLLDRDENGESEYRIDNPIIAREIWGEHTDKKIYLPKNLYIIGTVNTSDQNVFVMDTAFKRRFEFEYVDANEIAKDEQGEILNNFTFSFTDDEGQLNGLKFEWIDLYITLNQFITNKGEHGLGLTEDKQIGQFFIKFRANDEGYNYNQFLGKLLSYLWNDVQPISYSNVSIFKDELNNFSSLYKAASNNINVFSKAFLEQLINVKSENAN